MPTAGERLPPLQAPPISRTTLTQFAASAGDRNPIHLDIDTARAAGFDDVIAHGMLSMAYLGRMLTDWVPQEAIREFGVRFLGLTPAHGAPRCTGVVRSVKDTPGGRVATIDLEVRLQDGTVTLTGTAVVEI